MRRKSDKVKTLQGNFRHGRASKGVELPEPAKPECPAWLDEFLKTGKGRKM